MVLRSMLRRFLARTGVVATVAATVAFTQSLLRAVQFSTASEDPGNGDRTVTFALSDGDGATSAAFARQQEARTPQSMTPTLTPKQAPSAMWFVSVGTNP